MKLVKPGLQNYKNLYRVFMSPSFGQRAASSMHEYINKISWREFGKNMIIFREKGSCERFLELV